MYKKTSPLSKRSLTKQQRLNLYEFEVDENEPKSKKRRRRIVKTKKVKRKNNNKENVMIEELEKKVLRTARIKIVTNKTSENNNQKTSAKGKKIFSPKIIKKSDALDLISSPNELRRAAKFVLREKNIFDTARNNLRSNSVKRKNVTRFKNVNENENLFSSSDQLRKSTRNVLREKNGNSTNVEPSQKLNLDEKVNNNMDTALKICKESEPGLISTMDKLKERTRNVAKKQKLSKGKENRAPENTKKSLTHHRLSNNSSLKTKIPVLFETENQSTEPKSYSAPLNSSIIQYSPPPSSPLKECSALVNSFKTNLNSSPRATDNGCSTPLHGTSGVNTPFKGYSTPLHSIFEDSNSVCDITHSTPVKFHKNYTHSIVPKIFNASNYFGFDDPDTIEEPLVSPIKISVGQNVNKVHSNIKSKAGDKEIIPICQVIEMLKTEVGEPEKPDEDVNTNHKEEELMPDSPLAVEESNFPTVVFNPTDITLDEFMEKKPRRSYDRQVRRKKVIIGNVVDDESGEEEEEHGRIEKAKVDKKKGKGGKKKKETAMENWVKQFNLQCRQVDGFILCVE